MQLNNSDKAHVLAQALPYIQKYYNKVVVVKYGGNAMINEDLKAAVMSDIVLLSLVGIRIVLVHGGGPEITETLNAMGKESRFVGGLRYTDAETVKVVQMVLAGKTNKDLVGLLQQNKGQALGICGIDGKTIQVKKMDGDVGFVGEVTNVNPKLINDALDNGYIPVIATIGCDEAGDVYNINADAAASRIAAQLHAESLILLTDVRDFCGIKRMSPPSLPRSMPAKCRPSPAKASSREG